MLQSYMKTGLNNNYEMTVFEKLQTLIPPSEANNYKDVCDIFDEFLGRGLYAYYEETFSDTHLSLTEWIIKSEQSPKEVLYLVKHVFQIVVDIEETVNNDSRELLFPVIHEGKFVEENDHLRSWLVLATLMSLSQIPNLVMEGTWEDVLYELLKYIKTWDMDSEFSVYSLTSRTVRTLKSDFCWEWMIEIACSPTLCPSAYLRIEIFRLILLFDPEKIVFSNGKKIITAYVECISSINPDQLFVIMDNNLLSIRHLMLSICTLSLPWRLQHHISSKVVQDLHLNQMGKEVKFVANSLKVIGMFAQIAKTRYKDKSNYLRRCLNRCMYLFMFGHNNNFSENVYNHKLLLPSTYCALADITDGILTLSASMNDNNCELVESGSDRIRTKRMSLYNKIVKRRNDLVNDLEIPKDQFFHVKLCQREQSSHKFSNILFVKKAALVLTKLELGTICSDEIEPMSYYHNDEDDDSHTDSDDSSGSSFSVGPMVPLVDDYDDTDHTDADTTGYSSELEENIDAESTTISHGSISLNSDEETSSSGSRSVSPASINSMETNNECC